MANKNNNLHAAKAAKNDEFYTQYSDIQAELNAYLEYDENVFKGKTVLLPCDDPEWSNFTKFFAQNFENYGLKKLISTSYASASSGVDHGVSKLEKDDPRFDPEMSKTHGKIFTLTRDANNSGRIDYDDLEWEYLEGDGDFRSDEVKKLRDEADFIITNPPFSLFREFVAWCVEAEKKFLIIGNMNAVTYKEIFPLIKNNQVWVGANRKAGTRKGNTMCFTVLPDYKSQSLTTYDDKVVQQVSAWWFTNIEHGRRHQPLQLMTETQNIRHSKHKDVKGIGYQKYDNYNAIEVPFSDAIPDDYDGVMGVPISFLQMYCPEQFELIWTTDRGGDGMLENIKIANAIRYDAPTVKGVGKYKRIMIRHKPEEN